jgi:hypothetical protein
LKNKIITHYHYYAGLPENPPSQLETLVWWWVVRPDLGAAIAIKAPQKLKNIISQYILQN